MTDEQAKNAASHGARRGYDIDHKGELIVTESAPLGEQVSDLWYADHLALEDEVAGRGQ